VTKLAVLLVCVVGAAGCSVKQSQDETPSQTGPYRRMPSVPVGEAPASLALADFNGDGVLDLAVANDKANTVSVLRGKGDGTFSGRADLDAGTEPISLATADLDADGDTDIAVANRTGNTVDVFENHGDGSFASAVELATGASPGHVVARDINHDSRPDLLIPCADDDTLAVFLADSQGGFAPRADFPAGTNPVRITLVDLNQDGELDVVSATRVVPPTVSVVLGDGKGGFGPVTKYKASNRPGVVFPIAPLAITSGDIDEDGHPDVVVGNRGMDVLDGEAWVLAGDGSGALADPQAIPGVSVLAPAFLDLVDYDGDGHLDMMEADNDPTIAALVASIAGSGYSVCLTHGDGKGTFSGDNCMSTGDYPNEVASGDLNRDGKLDFVTADAGSNIVSVYLAR
jgi:hypothetical protein